MTHKKATDKKYFPTTVNLTQKAQVVKDEWGSIFGAKNILSAGLIWFGGLSESEKLAAIKSVQAKVEHVV